MSINDYFKINEGILPVRFFYGNRSSDEFLPFWNRKIIKTAKNGHDVYTVTFTENRSDPRLRVTAEVTFYDDGMTADWKLHMENIGDSNTDMIEKVSSIALVLPSQNIFLLHKSRGGISTADDFVQSDVIIRHGEKTVVETAGGRSTNKDNAYFTIDCGCRNENRSENKIESRLIIAVGWTGQWRCDFSCGVDGLEITGGMEDSHFVLYPGEKVTLPSILALFCNKNIDKAYSYFRKIILDYYIPKLPDRENVPYLLCNTCFTRGGGWLNECNAENQISLIKALKPLDVENVITDAGWFIGGWPNGAGNWTPDPQKYPDGMDEVAEAASKYSMRYGLWFELERVVTGTRFALDHPELLLSQSEPGSEWETNNMLADMGKSETRDYIYDIVENMFKIKNFTCYRQDFNMDPINYWRSADSPDRIGITEMKYIAGLYEYLDRIRANHPDIFMDGCSSGGRRMDLEMVKRFHTHQKTDFWNNNTVDQNSLFSLAHYLPNIVFTSHIARYDDYSFNSTIAATLCLGWIADSETENFNNYGTFKFERARKLIDRYQTVRPYLNKDFYPLTAPDATDSALIAAEYIDEQEQKGVLLIYKRENCTKNSITLKLKAVIPQATYKMTDLVNNKSEEITGASLMTGFDIMLDKTPDSKLIFFEMCVPPGQFAKSKGIRIDKNITL